MIKKLLLPVQCYMTVDGENEYEIIDAVMRLAGKFIRMNNPQVSDVGRVKFLQMDFAFTRVHDATNDFDPTEGEENGQSVCDG